MSPKQPKKIEYRWEFDLRSGPEALWPLVSDTNRFNRELGLPSVADAGTDAGAAAGNARRRLRARVVGVEMSWEEEPFEWARPYRFGVVRRYARGPLAEMRVRVELAPREGGGTRLGYHVTASARGSLVRAAVPFQMKLMRRKFERFFRQCDLLAARRADAGETAAPDAVHLAERTKLSQGGRARLDLIRQSLAERGAHAGLVERLLEVVERGDDLTLARLRPYALADFWGEPRRDVLELCLTATRAGLLDFRWELLCPLCRGPQDAPASLRDVRPEQHCSSCNIDFNVNFDRSVEVTFSPNPSVRRVESADYCMGGPGMTPHVVVQQLVEPGGARVVGASLEEGRYRLRALNLPGSQLLRVAAAGAHEATLRAAREGWPGDEAVIGRSPALRFENSTDAEQLLILEGTAWSDQAATAAEVTALQLFRDLFAEEALRPGDQISVGQMTILFTDLRGSTRLYREIGDAVAFGAVMNHFDVLRDAIAAEGGSIVKTLGDAVMAVFTRPARALRAVMGAQEILASPPEGVRPLFLKAGIHTGPCIAVTLNGRLDYFGSNVNIAARLEPLSTGADCVISSVVRDDPSVSAMLSTGEGGLAVEPLTTSLKGFDAESFDLWRVVRQEADAATGEATTEEATTGDVTSDVTSKAARVTRKESELNAPAKIS